MKPILFIISLAISALVMWLFLKIIGGWGTALVLGIVFAIGSWLALNELFEED